MTGNVRRPLIHPSRFIFEFVLFPMDSISTSFKYHLPTIFGHGSELGIAVDDGEGRDITIVVL